MIVFLLRQFINEYSILGVDKEENGILMYAAQQSKLLTYGSYNLRKARQRKDVH